SARRLEVRPVEAPSVGRAETEVVDVLDEVGADPFEQLRLTARDALDRREDQARCVEDRPEPADPRKVVVARAEEPEQREGDMRIEDLDTPALPVEEELGQPMNQTELGIGLEERDGRWRGAGRGLESDDLHLAPLVRDVQREQEGQDTGDELEA